MADWGTLAAVRARLTYETIDEESSPNQSEVTAWLAEAEAEIKTKLAAAGYSTSYDSGTNAALVLRKAATDYATSHVKNAWASRSGRDTDDDGTTEMDRYRAWVERLERDATAVAAELAGGAVADASQYQVASHATDPSDGDLSISNGDFAPVLDTVRFKL